MIFFDFLYYSIYSFYASYKEKGAESTAVSIVAGLQTINLMTVIVLFSFLNEGKAEISKLLIVGLFLVFEIYNYRRYLYQSAYSAKTIEVKWLEKPEAKRKRIKSLLVLYGMISIVTFFGLVVFIGSRK